MVRDCKKASIFFGLVRFLSYMNPPLEHNLNRPVDCCSRYWSITAT